MRTWILIKTCVVAMALCLCMPSASLASKRKNHRRSSVAIWKINSLGVNASISKNVRSILVRTLKRGREWQYVSRKLMLKRLRRARVPESASADRVAKASRVKFLLVGTLAGFGTNISLDLKVLSGKNGKDLRRLSVVLPQDKKTLKRDLDELLVRLLSPKKWTGGLMLVVSEDGAEVFLDGTRVATSPLNKPLENISPGKHILSIRKEGFGDFSQFVVVRYKQVAKLEVDLASATLVGLIYEKKSKAPKVKKEIKEPVPVLAKTNPMGWQEITGWTFLGVGAATLLSSGLLAWHADELEEDIARGWWSEGSEGILQSKLNEGKRITSWSNYTLIAGGSFALLSAGFLLWGYLAGPEDAGKTETKSTMLVPTSFSSGAGVALTGCF